MAPCPCGSGKRFKSCHGASSDSNPSLIKPSNKDLHLRALAQQQAGNLAAAIVLHRQVLATDPDDAITQHYLGLALMDLERPELVEEAFALLDTALEKMPEEPEFHNNMATVYINRGEYEAAIGSADMTLSLSPAHARAHCNKALALQEMGAHTEALALFERAVKLEPRLVLAQWNESLSLLALGRYQQGFALFEKRYQLPGYTGRTVFPNIERWDGVPIPGRKLTIIAEQGLGESLQYMRFAPYYADLGLEITLVVPETLKELTRTLDARITVVADNSLLLKFDGWTGMMSLPYHRKLSEKNVGSAAYLSVPADSVANMRAALLADSKHVTGNKLVGLCYAGNTQKQARRFDRFLFAEQLAVLAQMPGITWVSLQKGEAVTEAMFTQHFPQGISKTLNTLWDTAVLASSCDAVVSIDTVIAHLAGALGLHTHLLLHTPAEWRWCLGDSP
ncbi:MAG: hypothetical protein RLZZ502_960, partial [Pseudomonadota bacterium]